MGNFILDDPNIDTKNLTPEQIDFSYLITGNPKKRVIPFRPDLVNVCQGSAWAVVLFDQLYYYLEWKAEKAKKPITEVEIYKFVEPCNHPWYRTGDSLLEEIHITESKFRTVMKKIGYKVNKKTKDIDIKKSKSLILYRKDINNVTWYKLNPYILSVLKPKKFPKTTKRSLRKSGRMTSGSQGDSVRIYKEDITENTNIFVSSETKGNNFASQNRKLGPSGELRSQANAYSSLQKIGLNGNSSNKKTLPKIKIPKNSLKDFNFPDQVFEILNHWRLAKGKTHKNSKTRKTADLISNQIQELLLPGNNPYTPVLKENEFEFRQKKWTVQEIKDTIDYYTKELCKPIDKMYFNQFIIHQNFKNTKTRNLRDYSPLVETYQMLPQQLSFIAKKIKEDFTTAFPDVHIYDKTFINIATFLEQKLDEYKSYQPYGYLYFEQRFANEIFFIYMDKKVKPKGTYEELKYMANPQNLREFILWCSKLNLIKRRTDKEMREYKKIRKEEYKNQIKAYQMDIDRGKADTHWTTEKWEYFDFIKEQVEC